MARREIYYTAGGAISLLGALQVPELRRFARNFLGQNDAGKNVDNQLTEICDWLTRRGVDDSCQVPPSFTVNNLPSNDNYHQPFEILGEAFNNPVLLSILAAVAGVAILSGMRRAA